MKKTKLTKHSKKQNKAMIQRVSDPEIIYTDIFYYQETVLASRSSDIFVKYSTISFSFPQWRKNIQNAQGKYGDRDKNV